MNDNPWKVNSIQEFAFLNCPGSVITVIEFHSKTGEIWFVFELRLTSWRDFLISCGAFWFRAIKNGWNQNSINKSYLIRYSKDDFNEGWAYTFEVPFIQVYGNLDIKEYKVDF